METITESKTRTLYFTIHRGRFYSNYTGKQIQLGIKSEINTKTSLDFFKVTDGLMVLNRKLTVTLEGHEQTLSFLIHPESETNTYRGTDLSSWAKVMQAMAVESRSKPVNISDFLSKSSRATKYWIPLETDNSIKAATLEFSFVESVENSSNSIENTCDTEEGK